MHRLRLNLQPQLVGPSQKLRSVKSARLAKLAAAVAQVLTLPVDTVQMLSAAFVRQLVEHLGDAQHYLRKKLIMIKHTTMELYIRK